MKKLSGKNFETKTTMVGELVMVGGGPHGDGGGGVGGG